MGLKACTYQQIFEKCDDYDSLYYNAYQGITIEPTRFFDKDVVKKLALHADFKEMFRDLGWALWLQSRTIYILIWSDISWPQFRLSTITRGSREQMRVI